MTSFRNDLIPSRIRELLDYDPETGHLTWRVDRAMRVRAGDRAGYSDYSGYITIRINGTNYQAHRLAWLWMKGEWPEEEIDHINRIRDDNRWSNLREANRSGNVVNSPPREKLSDLPRGVHIRPSGKFQATIAHMYLGTFETADEAAEVYAIVSDISACETDLAA
jgi:hypothetical protein